MATKRQFGKLNGMQLMSGLVPLIGCYCEDVTMAFGLVSVHVRAEDGLQEKAAFGVVTNGCAGSKSKHRGEWSSIWSFRLRGISQVSGNCRKKKRNGMVTFREKEVSVLLWTLDTLCFAIARISLFPETSGKEFKESVSVSKADWG